MECFKSIEKMGLSERKKDRMYLRFYKLFKFSYGGEGEGEGEGDGEGEGEAVEFLQPVASFVHQAVA